MLDKTNLKMREEVVYFLLRLLSLPLFVLNLCGSHQDPVEDGGDGEEEEGDEEVLVDVDPGDLEAPGDPG